MPLSSFTCSRFERITLVWVGPLPEFVKGMPRIPITHRLALLSRRLSRVKLPLSMAAGLNAAFAAEDPLVAVALGGGWFRFPVPLLPARAVAAPIGVGPRMAPCTPLTPTPGIFTGR